MTRFSLSRSRKKIVPESVMLPDGSEIPVNADFRVVLKCMRTMRDRKLSNQQKEALICLYFFDGVGVYSPLGLFAEFLNDGRAHEDDSDPVVDFEQDAEVIYASFLKEYGIDLIDVPYLHWNKFKALFAGLGSDTPLGRRVSLRTLDTSKLTAKERAKAEKAKRSVQLEAEPFTLEEELLQKALDEALAEGRDPADAVRALNEYYSRQGGDG